MVFYHFFLLITLLKKKLKCFSLLTHYYSATTDTMSNTSIPQIYIPRVHTSYTWQDIKAIFDELLGEGCVKRVDVVKIKPRQEGDKPPPFNRVYVHIKNWPKELNETRDAIKAGETINLYPDDNEDHYWMCVLNTRVQDDKPKGKPAFEICNSRQVRGRGVTLGDHLTNKFDNLRVEEDTPDNAGQDGEVGESTEA